MSPSEARIACSLTSARFGERFDPRPYVHEADVDGEHPSVELAGLRGFPLLFDRACQPVQDAEALRTPRRRQLEPPPQDRLRHDRRALLEKANAQRLGGA